jgi:DNA mismatch repair protein MutS2
MNKSIFAFLEFDALKELLLRFTTSPLGAGRVRELSTLSGAEAMRFELAKTWEAVEFLQSDAVVSFSSVEDPTSILQHLQVEGLVLEALEILSLARLAETGGSIKSLFRDLDAQHPNLCRLAATIPNLKPIVADIAHKILPSGELQDNASPDLRRIRHAIQSTKVRIQRALESYMQKRNADQVLQDSFVTVRNERFVIPVKVEQKRAIQGVVHGTSSSGATIFLEPFDVIELNNDLISLQDQEKAEVHKILNEFTERLRREHDHLARLAALVAEFDFTFAKAKFSRRFRCCAPQINTDGVLAFENARHPLLEEALRPQGASVVPVSLRLDRDHSVLIISGPNAGGKTVSLKTAGLLTLMAHAGLPVPAEDATVPVLGQVLADIGDRQSIVESLSTFSSHILNIAEMVRGLKLPALVLLDEVGTGTDPDQGAALGIAIIDYFKQQGARVLATTHHNSIKAYAFNTPGVTSAATEFDESSLKPTYRLISGTAGGSSGLEIAQRLGLPSGIVEAARQLLDKKDVEAEKYLVKIKRSLTELEGELSVLKCRETELEAERARLKTEYAEKERAMMQTLENKIEDLLSSFHAEANKIIGDIKNRGTRLELNKEAQRRARSLKERLRRQLVGTDTGTARAAPPAELRVGDRVRIASLSLYGVVERVGDTFVEVNVNGKRIKERLSQIELVEPDGAHEQKLILPEGVHLELASDEDLKPELNVVGCTVDEALTRADKYLDRASLMSLDTVRLIHGHGTGKLKKAIANFLRDHPHVVEFDQNENRGGVTVVKLK